MTTLNDFVVEGCADVKRLSQLSSEEFRRIYIESMRKYVENHRRPVVCGKCYEEITSPENLVRYFGENLGLDCFRQTWIKEGKEDFWRRQGGDYYDLVLKSLE